MKNKIKIYFGYKHTEKPFGGANNFIRTLYNNLKENSEFEITEDINSDFDILFMNQMGIGPNHPNYPKQKYYKIKYIKSILQKKRTKPKIVARAVNLRSHSYTPVLSEKLNPLKWINILYNYSIDNNTLKIINMADHVVFQSNYQKSFFENSGLNVKKFSIVHNGANKIFKKNVFKNKINNGIIRIASSINTTRKTKRHDLIAEFSKIKNVNIAFFGIWPHDINPQNVNLKGKVTSDELIAEYENSHFFLHPAIKDPCPNSVIEAMYSGLPVLYNPDIGSSSELVGQAGFSINQNDLEGSLDFAVKNYDSAVEYLNKNKDYYSIDRALKEYTDVFKKVLNQ